MRPKTQSSLNIKLIILGFLLAFFLLLVLRTSFSSTSPQQQNPNPAPISHSTHDQEEEPSGGALAAASSNPTESPATTCPPSSSSSSTDHDHQSCTKIPPTLVDTLIHYVTTNITPQQTLREISVTSRVLLDKSPCKFLVFGLGRDSPMWSSLNFGGRTVFLEEDKSWIEQVRQQFPYLESYHVEYESKVHQAMQLMKIGQDEEECKEVVDPRSSKCRLALKGMPREVYETEWDLIMVDAPTGYHQDAPGRMTAIYTAGLMARNRGEGETHVFVHDVDRTVEDRFSKGFLCEGYMRTQEGRIRHFTIPSHRSTLATTPFCP
ncbi:hypothetical protein Sjap_018057 [Stephania japonica]|uniref:Polysaccharide biosynthesis domain-containing protein n=1 Tax=Stephania japonica TaxID=461633 RepID=A0AAP0I798_9MAGN